MHKPKTAKIIVFLSFMAFTFISAQEKAQEKLLFHDAVIARVGDSVISVMDIRQESAMIENELHSRISGEALEKEIVAVRRNIAEELINRELLYLEFKEKGFNLPGDLLQRRMDRVIVVQAAGSRERFEKMLAERGSSMLAFEEDLTKALAVELMYDQFVRRQVNVSPAIVRQYYLDNAAEFNRPDRYHLRLILLNKDDAADKTVTEIRKQLSAGKDFAELAKKFSTDKSSAADGGSLGWLNATDLKSEWLTAVKNLQPGQITEPLTDANGVILLQVAEFTAGGKTELDDKLHEHIEDELTQQEEKSRYKELIQNLSRKFFVRRYF